MPDKRTKQQCDELLKEAYEKYYVDVYRFCLSFLKKDKSSVDDCLQETFIVLYKKYLSGEEITYVKAFLFKTAENFIKKRSRDIAKSENTLNIDDVIHIVSHSDDMDEKLSFEEYSRQISDALSDHDAELFRLRYLEKYSLEEIVGLLNITVSAVGIRVFRLKKRLITIIENILDKE